MANLNIKEIVEWMIEEDSLIYTGNDRDYWSIQLTINKE